MDKRREPSIKFRKSQFQANPKNERHYLDVDLFGFEVQASPSGSISVCFDIVGSHDAYLAIRDMTDALAQMRLAFPAAAKAVDAERGA